MMFRFLSLALLALALTACGSKDGGASGDQAKAGDQAAGSKAAGSKATGSKPAKDKPKTRVVPMPKAPMLARGEDGKVVLTAAGGKIAPPAKKSEVPTGAWICDMGTVHYARSEKGDGKCPLCGMDLVQLAAAPEAAPAPTPAAAPAAPAGDGAPAAPTGHEGHEH